MRKTIGFSFIIGVILFSEKAIAENSLPAPTSTPEFSQKTTRSSSKGGTSAKEYPPHFSSPSSNYLPSYSFEGGGKPIEKGEMSNVNNIPYSSPGAFSYVVPPSFGGNTYFSPVPYQQMVAPTGYYIPPQSPSLKSKVSMWMLNGLMILTPLVGVGLALWRGEWDTVSANDQPVALIGALFISGILSLIQSGINIAQQGEEK